MNFKIELPDEIRDIILDGKMGIQHAVDAYNGARADKTAEITRLEQSLVFLGEKIADLAIAAVESDAAAADLVNGERRETAIKARIEELRQDLASMEKPSIVSATTACRVIYKHWQPAIYEHLAAALKPFGMNNHVLSGLGGQCHALQILRIIVELPQKFHYADPGIVVQLFSYFDRALRGQVNLSSDESSDPLPETAAASDPSVDADSNPATEPAAPNESAASKTP